MNAELDILSYELRVNKMGVCSTTHDSNYDVGDVEIVVRTSSLMW